MLSKRSVKSLARAIVGRREVDGCVTGVVDIVRPASNNPAVTIRDGMTSDAGFKRDGSTTLGSLNACYANRSRLSSAIDG